LCFEAVLVTTGCCREDGQAGEERGLMKPERKDSGGKNDPKYREEKEKGFLKPRN